MYSHIKGYTVAPIAVVIAFLLTQLVWWLIQPHLYPLFLAAVMVSSWSGGIGPGLFATVLSAVLCNYFFIPPVYSLVLNRDGIVGLLQFALVALLISFLNATLRSTQRQAELNAKEAQRNYEYLQQSQENLHQSEERYRLFVEGATNYAIFMMNADGQITSWNVGAERILGYSEAEAIGQPLSLIFTPEDIEQGVPQQALGRAVAEGMSRDDRWHLCKNGSRFWAHGVVTPIRDAAGSLRGFAKILQDLTERKQSEEEREQLLFREQAARAEAEAANRAKDNFLAVVSHELRTPMTAIIGWAGMLRSGMLDESRATGAIESIERNASWQIQLIEDLLDISRIIRGEISLNFTQVNLVEVITAALEVVHPTAVKKEIELEFVRDSLGEIGKRVEGEVSSGTKPSSRESGVGSRGSDSSPLLIWGDSERLQQVIVNLLSNAVKFTPEGGRVGVRLTQGSREQRAGSRGKFTTYHCDAQIQVIDTGIGISPDFLPYIFDRFRQADSTSARSNKGLGLGLAIARHLVELHGGSIQANSPGRGQGTTFTVKLPVRDASPINSVQVSSAADQMHSPATVGDAMSSDNPPTLNGLRVLIVEDEADTREWISTVLETCGARVIAVNSVDEAMVALETERPDVLISDVGLPGEDGYGLIRKIRELEPRMGGTIPAVALTAYARVEDYQEAIAAGFQLHVAKPIRAAELIAIVASLARMAKNPE
ncbi:PAS domain S-box protein [Chroococcidiopsis sp. FACHB-1243]|uniref:ATP-binding response regulator n=1 Tax=Chroococcidiopsis sp. [FACHB-1243] TaxID=2692781 RepID=UPI0017851410|nr:ATP-binding protein [Chroococcidiopsis sp. [FACHB-1243]]MBD2307730.1 PAS domain S-box protein [Chroococcidiopsis sp. [FACHB-1243]]